MALAQQVADLVQLRKNGGSAEPTRRQDMQFLFLAATPQQAKALALLQVQIQSVEHWAVTPFCVAVSP